MVPTAVPRRGSKGRVDGAIPRRFNVEEEQGIGMEERGASVEAHA
jgi:hypothetical protein